MFIILNILSHVFPATSCHWAQTLNQRTTVARGRLTSLTRTTRSCWCFSGCWQSTTESLRLAKSRMLPRSLLTAHAGRGKGPGEPVSWFQEWLQHRGGVVEAGLTESPLQPPSSGLAWRGQWFPLRTADLCLFSDIQVLNVLVRLKAIVEHQCYCSVGSLQHRDGYLLYSSEGSFQSFKQKTLLCWTYIHTYIFFKINFMETNVTSPFLIT